jgi:hypothetical protein
MMKVQENSTGLPKKNLKYIVFYFSVNYRESGKPLSPNEELKELFQYITRYRPQDIELEPELKPFIPEYIPAIGDIDAFIKV